MSAEIPSSMPLSDLLKPTGYNCPSELQGKTFDEATSGSDTKISTNTAATIDVSTYTEPVEITPAEGYDATKKTTITLSNIPQPGSSWHCWSTSNDTSLGDEVYMYLPFAAAPATIPNDTAVASALGQGFPVEQMTLAEFYAKGGVGIELVSVTKVSDNELSVVLSNDGVPTDPFSLYRNSFLAGYDL